MKHLSITKVSIYLGMFFLLFLFSNCSLIGLDDDDDCKNDTIDEFEYTFKPYVNVAYSDYVPFEGKVDFEIYKVYCDGVVSGKFTKNGYTDENGFWDLGYNYAYKYKYEGDYVQVKITVTGYDSTGLELIDQESYYYYHTDVEDSTLPNTIFAITLTWPSTQ